MPNVSDGLRVGSGGGTPAYFTGKEVTHADLSGGNLTLVVTDLGKTHIIYSSVDGKSVTLPASNAAGMALHKGAGFIVLPGSRPVRFYNAGTAGTNPVLEVCALPGAKFVLFANSIGSATGDWRGGGTGLFQGPVPVTLPNIQEAGIDLGSDMLIASMHAITAQTGILVPNCLITALSSTLFAVTFVPNAGTSVITYAVSYNHTTDAWTWGAPVTSFSSANQWLHPRVLALSATTFVIAAWEATNAKVSARACTVAGTVITQGVTILSGAWGTNPNNANILLRGTLVTDSATTCFLAGARTDTSVDVIHFSVSGTTLTQDGGANFAASAGVQSHLGGYSPSANVLDIAINSASSTHGLGRYTYAAGNVTNTWNRLFKAGQGGYFLQCADATNRVYYHANAGGWMTRSVLNAGATDFSESHTFRSPVLAGAVDSTALDIGLKFLFINDNEFLIMSNLGENFYSTLTLANPTTSLRGRIHVARNATNGAPTPACNIQAAPMMFGPETFNNAHYMVTGSINSTLRRFALLFSNKGQSVAEKRGFYMAMFDMPRNYDDFTW